MNHDSEPAAAPEDAEPASGPGLFTRFGLAIASPRWALTMAADRRTAGRSGSDIIAGFLFLLLATDLRGLASAVWMGTAVDAGFGLRAAIRVLTGSLTVYLALLVIGALVLFALAGAKRNLARAFDLACVAALPLVFVDLTATVIVRAAGFELPGLTGWLFTGVAYGWMGALVALAIRPARIAPARVPAPPLEAMRPARRLGWAVAALLAVGVVTQIVWITQHLELVKPMSDGESAPDFVLPQIDATGKLAAPVTLSSLRGKVTVLDFWATWCGPCLQSMPKLEQLARSHPDVSVLAINIDDPAAARALFNQHAYTMKLLEDTGGVSERYGAATIPYTVILDRQGVIRHVVRGTGRDPEHDLTALVEHVAAEH